MLFLGCFECTLLQQGTQSEGIRRLVLYVNLHQPSRFYAGIIVPGSPSNFKLAGYHMRMYANLYNSTLHGCTVPCAAGVENRCEWPADPLNANAAVLQRLCQA
eukprot:s5168_g8.t1